VNWKDGHTFCETMATKVTDLDDELTFRLPREAEWEYAGRVGTTSALYTGRLTIKGERDGPKLEPIAWYGGNSGVEYEGGHDSSGWDDKEYDRTRAGTHPVAEKDANPWSLCGMLGYV